MFARFGQFLSHFSQFFCCFLDLITRKVLCVVRDLNYLLLIIKLFCCVKYLKLGKKNFMSGFESFFDNFIAKLLFLHFYL